MAVVVTSRSFSDNKTSSVYLENGDSVYIDEYNNTRVEHYTNVDDADLNVAIDFAITKSNEEKGLISGWASVAINADGSLPLDWEDDVISPDVLEKAAIDFMIDYRDSGEVHKGTSKGVVVESIVFTKDKQQAIGIPEGTVPEGWFITVKTSDSDILAKVKSGEYKMFSIQGAAKRVKI